MKVRCLWLFLLCLVSATTAVGQSAGKQVTEQHLYWLTFISNLKFNAKWSLTSEVHERRFTSPDKQHQFVLRSQARYALGENWEAVAGFTYFLQSPHDPWASERLAIPELRPHIQFNYNQPLGRFTITHRYRAEKRFFRNAENGKLTDGYNTNYRFRYRLGVEFHVVDIRERPLKLKVNDELLINAGKNILYNRFDQNRIYGGINYALLPSLEVELGYQNWYQQRSAGNTFYNRHIVNLIINHKLDLSRKKGDTGH